MDLKMIFSLVNELNSRAVKGVDYNDIPNDPALMTEWLLKYSRALTHEVIELEDSLPWKHWSTSTDIDLENLKVEVIDILFFWVALAQCAGLNEDDVSRIFLKKLEVNHNRLDNAYNHVEDKEMGNQDVK